MQAPWQNYVREQMRQLRRAMRQQVHKDAEVTAAWQRIANNDAKQDKAFARLEGLLARSTGSINNSYLKVQISSGIVAGLIVVFLTVFGQMPGVNWPLLMTGTIMEALSIGLAFLITTPRTIAWKQVVATPGAFAILQSREAEYMSLSKRVHHNRVVLLGNRRLAWISTWVLTLPGLALAILSWAPVAGSVTLAAVIVGAVLYRKRLHIGRPLGSLEYPS